MTMKIKDLSVARYSYHIPMVYSYFYPPSTILFLVLKSSNICSPTLTLRRWPGFLSHWEIISSALRTCKGSEPHVYHLTFVSPGTVKEPPVLLSTASLSTGALVTTSLILLQNITPAINYHLCVLHHRSHLLDHFISVQTFCNLLQRSHTQKNSLLKFVFQTPFFQGQNFWK